MLITLNWLNINTIESINFSANVEIRRDIRLSGTLSCFILCKLSVRLLLSEWENKIFRWVIEEMICMTCTSRFAQFLKREIRSSNAGTYGAKGPGFMAWL